MCKAHSKVTHIKQQKYFHHLVVVCADCGCSVVVLAGFNSPFLACRIQCFNLILATVDYSVLQIVVTAASSGSALFFVDFKRCFYIILLYDVVT